MNLFLHLVSYSSVLILLLLEPLLYFFDISLHLLSELTFGKGLSAILFPPQYLLHQAPLFLDRLPLLTNLLCLLLKLLHHLLFLHFIFFILLFLLDPHFLQIFDNLDEVFTLEELFEFENSLIFYILPEDDELESGELGRDGLFLEEVFFELLVVVLVGKALPENKLEHQVFVYIHFLSKALNLL